MVHLPKQLLDFGEQVHSHLLEFLDILFGQVFLEEHVIHGKLFVALEALAHIAFFLFTQVVRQLHQFLESLFYRRTVLLLVVVFDDLLVTLIEIDSRRIGTHHLGNSFLQQLLYVFHHQVSLLASGKLVPEQIEIDAANVETAAIGFGQIKMLQLQMLVHNTIDGHTKIGNVGILALLLQLLVNSLYGILLLLHRRGS